VEFNRYHLISTWRLAAPPGAVYQALRDVDRYPHWWPQVRQVHRLDEKAGRLRIRSVLPYDLVMTARDRYQDEAAGVLEAELAGDQAGWSRWTVSPAGAGSRAVFEEEVRPGKAVMRRLALPARPLFLANHAVMMRAGERGLRHYLAAGPPPPTGA
jgi:uncharacterized protein YndB with AHSA1/START domain